MAAREFEEDAEKPLDPAAERLRQKMVRLLAVSIGIMFAAVMAVLAAVVYKIGSDRPAASPGVAAIELPAGAAIEETVLAGDTVMLRVREAGRQRLLVFDLGTGRLARTVDIVPR